MTVARLLVSYTEDSTASVTFGMDIANYEHLSACDVLARIKERIAQSFYGRPYARYTIQNVIELSPKADEYKPFVVDKGYSNNCIACGKENGHGGLPCPTMSAS